MLQIGVHHGKEGRRACQNAFDACGRQSAPAETLQAAYIGFVTADGANLLSRAVLGIVIDEDGFPFDPGEHFLQTRDQRLDIAALVESREHDGELDRPDEAARQHRRARHIDFIQARLPFNGGHKG